MSELETLTKSLTQIVSNLMDIISKNTGGSLLQPDSQKIKKTTDMTYHEFIAKVLVGR
jgi:hypothetical protein